MESVNRQMKDAKISMKNKKAMRQRNLATKNTLRNTKMPMKKK